MNLLRSLKNKLSSEPVPKTLIKIPADEILSFLEKESETFFPSTGRWVSSCFKQPDELYWKYMPCHLRDYKWLSALMYKDLEEKGYSVPQAEILHFMEHSEIFNKRRLDYELEIVKWQIEWMDNNGENWLIPDGFGGEFWMRDGNCDKCFRQGVIKTLTAIGMNRYVIEQGLEYYAYLWRTKYMNLAFENRYNPTINNFMRRNPVEQLPQVEEGHKEKWLTLRMYQYYKNHKQIMEELDLVTPDLLFDSDELGKLLVEVKMMNFKRKLLIEKLEREKGAKFLSHHTEDDDFTY